jgi:hypothetical protein
MDYDEQVKRNIEHARRLVTELSQNPDLLDQVPTGANVIPMPEADAELSRANRKLIKRRKRTDARATPPADGYLDVPSTPAADASEVLPVEPCLGNSRPILLVDI